MRKTYSPEFKAKVVRAVLREDKTLSQVAAEYQVHPNQVSQWRDQALSGMVGLFSRSKETDWAAKEADHEQEKQQLYAEIGRLTTQLSWLKKTSLAEGGIPPDEKRPGGSTGLSPIKQTPVFQKQDPQLSGVRRTSV